MTREVDLTEKHAEWPRDQWHPAYDSFKNWLDEEAPESSVLKRRNKPRDDRYRARP